MPVRITTWNVNGIRNPFSYQPWRDHRSYTAMFDILEADIVIMQELKIQRKDLQDDMVLVPGWDCYFSLPKHKKGYSGVGIYTRQSSCAPIRAEEGILGVLSAPGKPTCYRDLPEDECIGGYPSLSQIADLGVDAMSLDAEGRCVILEFPAFVLLGVYSPANSSGQRDDYRYAFLSALDIRIRNLDKIGKRVILTGDLNVSRDERDTAGAEEDKQKMGITHDEYISTPNRRIFNQLLEGGDVVGERDEGRDRPVLWDILRGFHPTRQRMYTHWEQKINARPGNYGSRIDHILCSVGMKDWFQEANIQEGLMGSDHCPVYAVLKDEVELDGDKMSIFDMVNPPGIFKNGQRIRGITAKDHPPFSGKLMPEFDKRRSIKEMFKTKERLPPREPPQPPSPTASSPMAAVPRIATAEEPELPEREKSESIDAAQDESSSPKTTNKPKRHRANGNPPKAKRSKLSAPEAKGSSKDQTSLRTYFTSRTSTPSNTVIDTQDPPVVATSHSQTYENLDRPSRTEIQEQEGLGSSTAVKENGGNSSASTSQLESEDREIIDPIISKEQWDTLFSKRAPPKCEHGEPCTKLQTKIKGFNSGRHFWICARPLGPSGSKERNTQWRCRTFIWASDWNGGG